MGLHVRVKGLGSMGRSYRVCMLLLRRLKSQPDTSYSGMLLIHVYINLHVININMQRDIIG